jgi:hypothetical protein
MRLVPNEFVAAVPGGEARVNLALVLPDSAGEIVGHTDINRAVALVGQDVDVKRHLARTPYDLGPGIRRDERQVNA